MEKERRGEGRNPFIFLGHFNGLAQKLSDSVAGSRNPFIFLGHFNT